MAQISLMGMAAVGHNTAEYLHTLIELKKLAFADRDRWVADPEFADFPVKELLGAEYLSERALKVGTQAAEDVSPGIDGPVATDAQQRDAGDSGDTVYITAVDQWGNAVSWIQSLFASFGSGLLAPETGVVLQNRGGLFTLDPNHPNVVAPGKRPYHTLTPHAHTADGVEPGWEFGLYAGHTGRRQPGAVPDSDRKQCLPLRDDAPGGDRGATVSELQQPPC